MCSIDLAVKSATRQAGKLLICKDILWFNNSMFIADLITLTSSGPTPAGFAHFRGWLKRNVITMKRLLLACIAAMSCSGVIATTTVCPTREKLAGTYKTEVRTGYTPNELVISRAGGAKTYTAQLNSYWEPKPFDNGARGSVGNFSGELIVPNKWACVSFLLVREEGVAVGGKSPMCVLTLSFNMTRTLVIDVYAFGACDYFHGINAYPNGTYVLQKQF